MWERKRIRRLQEKSRYINDEDTEDRNSEKCKLKEKVGKWKKEKQMK